MTYNVHRCRGMDRRTRPDRVAAVLRDIDGWMPKLRRRAIIAGDDYDWDTVFEAVNARFSHVNITQHGAIWWVRLN